MNKKLTDNEVFGYRDRKLFEEKYIFEGMTLNKLAEYFSCDWSCVEDWRIKHGFPKHSDREGIISIYGEDIFTYIKRVKSETYSESNKGRNIGRTLEEIYGSKEKALAVIEKRRASSIGIKRSADFKTNLSKLRKGSCNPNYKGGFYSLEHKEIERNLISSYIAAAFNKISVIDRDFTCETCGKKSLKEMCGHHKLSFSTIFGEICNYATRRNCLNTEFILKEIYQFHLEYKDKIYKCLCLECHKKIHSKEGKQVIKQEILELIHLLDKYKPKIKGDKI